MDSAPGCSSTAGDTHAAVLGWNGAARLGDTPKCYAHPGPGPTFVRNSTIAQKHCARHMRQSFRMLTPSSRRRLLHRAAGEGREGR